MNLQSFLPAYSPSQSSLHLLQYDWKVNKEKGLQPKKTPNRTSPTCSVKRSENRLLLGSCMRLILNAIVGQFVDIVGFIRTYSPQSSSSVGAS